jgi:hypothetical protein
MRIQTVLNRVHKLKSFVYGEARLVGGPSRPALEVELRARRNGHRHHAAVRALAHKWVKIILAMLRTNTPYDEAVFLNSRRRYLLNS